MKLKDRFEKYVDTGEDKLFSVIMYGGVGFTIVMFIIIIVDLVVSLKEMV